MANTSAMPEVHVTVHLATSLSSWLQGQEITGCAQLSAVLLTSWNKPRGMTLDLDQ